RPSARAGRRGASAAPVVGDRPGRPERRGGGEAAHPPGRIRREIRPRPMTAKRSPLRLAFYGDDLTGSTDALESLVLAGVRSVLFLDPPARSDLARHPPVEAIGVAGATRAMGTAALAGVLRPAFRALRALRPRHVHYKICSTFDSAPAIGSIGR